MSNAEEGHECSLVFQVAAVERALVGVSPIAKVGHEVRMREGSGEIIHLPSGRQINLRVKGGVYVMTMYFLVDDPASTGGAEPLPDQGFGRPGQ